MVFYRPWVGPAGPIPVGILKIHVFFSGFFIFKNLCEILEILTGNRARGPARVAPGPSRIALFSIRFSLFQHTGTKDEKH